MSGSYRRQVLLVCNLFWFVLFWLKLGAVALRLPLLLGDDESSAVKILVS